MKIRFTAVTDIHNHQKNKANKIGSEALRLVGKLIRNINEKPPAKRPLFLAELGDRIIASGRKDKKGPVTDAFHQGQLTALFNTLAVPLISVDGNHDRLHLPPANVSTVHEFDGVTVIAWDPDVNITKPDGLTASTDDMKWLEDALAGAQWPCIVLSHVPLDNDSQDDENAKKLHEHAFSFYREGPEIRKILESSGKVALCINGHRHCERQRPINGIWYLTLQSLVQNHRKNDAYTGKPTSNYYDFDMDDNRIKVTKHGKGNRTFTLDMPRKYTSSPA